MSPFLFGLTLRLCLHWNTTLSGMQGFIGQDAVVAHHLRMLYTCQLILVHVTHLRSECT